MIEQARLKELLDYCCSTGEFRWRVNRSGYAKAGTLAGRLDSTGYRQISVDGRRYGAHRLAWLYMNGEWPSAETDHVNGSRDDNRISNLRAVDRATNMKNKRRYRSSSCPHPGVRREKGRWHAYIGNSYVGSFGALDAAVSARRAEEARQGYHANHGRA